MAEETFIVLREAMAGAGKVAIARLVLSSRERMVTVAPREKGMYVCTLRAPNEVRATATYFDDIPDGKPDAEMLELAQALIKQKTTKFDPKAYEDRYEAALMAMIKEKLKGRVGAVEPARILDLAHPDRRGRRAALRDARDREPRLHAAPDRGLGAARTRVVAHCVAPLHCGEPFDLVADLAIPLPVTMIAEMLGVEPSGPRLQALVRQRSSTTPPAPAAASRSIPAHGGVILELILVGCDERARGAAPRSRATT